MEQKILGETPDGEAIMEYTLKDAGGTLTASVMNYGATLLSLTVTDRSGNEKDVVLGHTQVGDYFTSPTYYGMTVARYANRIGGGTFTLDGKTYHTDKNDGNNTNHSGFHPLCHRIWQTTDTAEDKITFSCDSPDGDMGFGGNMHIDVTYSLKDNALFVDYHVRADADTVFNPTNHSYFNLKGHGNGDVLDHSMIVYADEMTFANAESLPDGSIRKVANTPFDFRAEKSLGQEIDADYDMIAFGKGYDHNYVLRGDRDDFANAQSVANTDGKTAAALPLFHETLSRAVTLIAPDRSLFLDVYTDLPGVQIYTGNYIEDGSAGKDGKTYVRRGGVAIETQFYPNAVNIPTFPQPRIQKDRDYYSRSIYRFS